MYKESKWDGEEKELSVDTFNTWVPWLPPKSGALCLVGIM